MYIDDDIQIGSYRIDYADYNKLNLLKKYRFKV